MKMVKTFIKTQHQHVMPPEKGKEKKRKKENAQANEPCPLAERAGLGLRQLQSSLEDKARRSRWRSL